MRPEKIIDLYIRELARYSFKELCTKPAPGSWSIGQMYVHLISDTRFYIDQVRSCVSNEDNADGEATAFARMLLNNNEFPNELIEGAPDNANIPQPESKELLMEDIMKLRNEVIEISNLVSQSSFKGKSLHPGFQFLNAREWLQLTEMHFRHHLRQKKRIDDFLSSVILQKVGTQ